MSVIKKLQFKDQGQAVLVINPPKVYEEVMALFEGEVHTEAINPEGYDFVQVFGTSNGELKELAKSAENSVKPDGLFWLCYPKKTSKTYKGSDCSRDTVMYLLADEGYEPVRQIAIDDDWSALRFRKPEKIKTMKRGFAVTDAGKQRTEQ
ncbi:hypothetical protein QE429_000272 [Bacillus sp. SORGH_AS 510]|uniref:DUF3052 domain-containing protein n=1 Tax=Bacillus sp. SORGH_AS_0510 TaxID=3041771 RepID=UPI00277F0076|nr:DUF3052 domain-containing protein [Bacillus sp. SORGH_AS_0510]MDQ1143445.1 hypothetical protein [Bacillus sp. SORGH_AS_0510]